MPLDAEVVGGVAVLGATAAALVYVGRKVWDKAGEQLEEGDLLPMLPPYPPLPRFIYTKPEVLKGGAKL